jgi:radical SAM protein with 4Fe4S-binding SPASM domain
MVLRQNRHELWPLQRFVEDDLGMSFKFDAMINPRLDGGQRPLRHRLEPVEVVALDLAEPRRMEEWRRFCSQFVVPVESPSGGPMLYTCGAGVFSFSIDPYGGLSVCTMDANVTYDLRSGSFDDGWRRFLGGVRSERATRETKCSACELRSLCGMCPANARMVNGDPEEPVEYLCHVAHLRAVAFGIETASHGDCEFCPGGDRHDELLEELEMIRRTATRSPEGVMPPFESVGARGKVAGEERV